MSGVTFDDMKQQQAKQAPPGPEFPSSISALQNLDISVKSTTTDPEYSLQLGSQPSLGPSYGPLQAKRKVPVGDDIKLPLGRHLTDPFFQDLDQNARFYISHCKR